MTWHRVFAAGDAPLEPAAVLEFLNGLGAAGGSFGGDEAGWFRADLTVNGTELHVERYLATESGIRAELNSWAAWVETHETFTAAPALMERFIQTKQLLTLRGGDDRVCLALTRYFVGVTGGLYQVDGAGVCDADGTLFIADDDPV